MISKAWDVVVTPFPFTDAPQIKRRPALVLSTPTFNANGFTLLAMITTAKGSPWAGDTKIDHAATGLNHERVVRMKLFTLDSRLIERQVGSLSAADRRKVIVQLKKVLPI